MRDAAIRAQQMLTGGTIGLVISLLVYPERAVLGLGTYAVVLAGLLAYLLAVVRRQTKRLSEVSPEPLRRILVTVGTSNPNPSLEPDAEGHPFAVRGYQLLFHADLAVHLDLEKRRGMVEKYRHGRTDEIDVDVVVVKRVEGPFQ